ncbi:hypothetical protein [Thermomonospora umbrina]|uniref:Uncharacterized protein n=1 Tax=Thermomonospora umbrina TaxID=111806 RepID=A0A3D9SWY1_9ACTN|nr:hypothetical protein [Thermomonospora umbrina]REF00460.1 hypothetical protein DFJ69_5998 [Thermomonospora umbrina]
MSIYDDDVYVDTVEKELMQIRELQRDADAHARRVIERALDGGRGWEEIAGAVGVADVAAMQRYYEGVVRRLTGISASLPGEASQ